MRPRFPCARIRPLRRPPGETPLPCTFPPRRPRPDQTSHHGHRRLQLRYLPRPRRRRGLHVGAQQGQVELDQTTYDRYATLVRSDSISKANYDQARFTLKVDKNKLESLRQQTQVQIARLAGNPDIPVAQHPQYLQAKAQVDE